MFHIPLHPFVFLCIFLYILSTLLLYLHTHYLASIPKTFLPHPCLSSPPVILTASCLPFLSPFPPLFLPFPLLSLPFPSSFPSFLLPYQYTLTTWLPSVPPSSPLYFFSTFLTLLSLSLLQSPFFPSLLLFVSYLLPPQFYLSYVFLSLSPFPSLPLLHLSLTSSLLILILSYFFSFLHFPPSLSYLSFHKIIHT